MTNFTPRPFSIYIIENRLNHFYTGICRELTRRFGEHCANGKLCAKALRGKGPLKLIYAAELESHSTALKAEIWVKKLSRSQKALLIENKMKLPFDHMRHDDNYLHEVMNTVVP